jgi:hypothetical protein
MSTMGSVINNSPDPRQRFIHFSLALKHCRPYVSVACRNITQNSGAVAQLGERYNGIVEVRGSIPLGSTNNSKDLALTD